MNNRAEYKYHAINEAHRRHHETIHLLDQCFTGDIDDLKIKLIELYPENWNKRTCVQYSGVKFPLNSLFSYTVVPTENMYPVLEEFYELYLKIEKCRAMLRWWNNYTTDFQDFLTGLPGVTERSFSDPKSLELFNVIKTDTSFEEMETRLLVNKLL